ncbi:MAG: HAMP domain-containing sensor histidine kinase [Nitrospirota bacterium]
MKIEQSIKSFLKTGPTQDRDINELVRELLEQQANEKDISIKTQLLKNLVFQYSLAERKLAELNQLKNKFLGITAHDLRNPIVSIRGFSELILGESENLTNDQRELLTIINTVSNQMLTLLNDLLDVSIIESGKLDLQLELASFSDFLVDRVKINTVIADKKGIKLHADFDDVPETLFDSNRIGQVIDNLISNAIKFSPPSANIYVKIKKDDEVIRVSVKDEGPGISMDDKLKLFGEYQRLTAKPTGGEKSTGLGLSIAKKIVEAHRGKIWAESEPGSGATFLFTIPLR